MVSSVITLQHDVNNKKSIPMYGMDIEIERRRKVYPSYTILKSCFTVHIREVRGFDPLRAHFFIAFFLLTYLSWLT